MTDKTPKLEIRNLRKSFGALAATDDVNLSVYADEIHALIGPNGAGKTTLISQISGEIMPDSGQILLDGKDITRVPPHQRAAVGLARSFQISQLYHDFTVEDNVAMAVQAGTNKRFSMWRDARKDQALRGPARDALAKVGLMHRANDLVSSLAHGEKRQLELAVALSLNAPVLLLDEVTAELDEEGRGVLFAALAARRTQAFAATAEPFIGGFPGAVYSVSEGRVDLKNETGR